MGCLYSCFIKKSHLESRLLEDDSKLYESISDVDGMDLNDFSSNKAKQIMILDYNGSQSMKVSVEDFLFLKVHL